MTDKTTLGARLRELRLAKGLGLREAATIAGINHGYLSQLERDEVAQPAPPVLQKLAAAYDEPFLLLMRWANYLEDDPQGLSANQSRALKIMGEPTAAELQAIKAVLDAMRAGRADMSALQRLDGHLDQADRAEIRRHVLALLRRADALDVIPTPLDQVTEISKLVIAGEVTLSPAVTRRLRERFGDLVDKALELILGSVQFDSREVYLQKGLYHLKHRFVHAHEIGHDLLPWHRELYASLDDKTRLKPEVHDQYERQANQAAIEILTQGDRLRAEADDSALSFDLINRVGSQFEISVQATARHVVEETHQACALAISYRGSGTGKLMPPHLYSSRSFEEGFHWQSDRAPAPLIQQHLRAAQRGDALEPITLADVRGRIATVHLDSLCTPQAVFVLFRCSPEKKPLLTRLTHVEWPLRSH
ncbi:helix-turn-helix domain-containing protein [Kribbella sp. VKM Ac-2566]|uniref:helix-turn-helix domain-containing protein n=1 Tax=Kribbella sp. VKM Ac-2566 TaxID=2512218 RepID=UPI001416F052|nr:XRE family transcriptional regulator [Kribbella sp. VKM Ac-2566]